MTKNTIEITEDDLHAYVDKQLPEDKLAAVEALIYKDPSVAKQVREWQQQNEMISALFASDSSDSGSENAELNLLIESSRRTQDKSVKYRIPYAIAASLFLMIAGSALGWVSNDMLRPVSTYATNFMQSAVSAHQVYTAETLHPVEVAASEQQHLRDWLSKRLNHPLHVPDIEAYGYSLLGGRLLSLQEGLPAAQLMYENKQGTRVTLMLTKDARYRDREFQLGRENSINTSLWMNATVAYSVLGNMAATEFEQISMAIHQQLNTHYLSHLALYAQE